MRSPVDGNFEISEVGMCYFAALIEGLRLINEKAEDRPDLAENFDANALARFVQAKGQRIAALIFPGEAFAVAQRTPAVFTTKSSVATPALVVEPSVELKPRCKDCGDDRSVGSAERCRPCYRRRSKARKETSAVKIALKRDAKTYSCRWCGFAKHVRGACPQCGRKSNTWSSKRAETTDSMEPTHNLTAIGVLLEIEKRLAGEIRWICTMGIDATFDQAVAAFKEVVAREQLREIKRDSHC